MKRLCLVMVVACVGVACGGGTSDSVAESTAAAGTDEAASGGAVTTVDSPLGEILVDASGRTVYVFTNDTEGASTCNDECAVTWPPVPSDVTFDPSLDAGLFGQTTRDDGVSQLTVAGRPVYLYAADSAPGDVNGQGSGGVWFAIDPSGEPVAGEAGADETSTTAPATTEPAGRYDY